MVKTFIIIAVFFMNLYSRSHYGQSEVIIQSAKYKIYCPSTLSFTVSDLLTNNFRSKFFLYDYEGDYGWEDFEMLNPDSKLCNTNSNYNYYEMLRWNGNDYEGLWDTVDYQNYYSNIDSSTYTNKTNYIEATISFEMDSRLYKNARFFYLCPPGASSNSTFIWPQYNEDNNMFGITASYYAPKKDDGSFYSSYSFELNSQTDIYECVGSCCKVPSKPKQTAYPFFDNLEENQYKIIQNLRTINDAALNMSKRTINLDKNLSDKNLTLGSSNANDLNFSKDVNFTKSFSYFNITNRLNAIECSAPIPVILNFYGQHNLFDVTSIPNIDFVRTVLISFGYVFGMIYFFKDL